MVSLRPDVAIALTESEIDLWEDHIENRSKFINYKKTAVMMLSWEDSDLEKEALDQEVASYLSADWAIALTYPR